MYINKICRNTGISVSIQNKLKKKWYREFPGSPVARTPHFHCQGCRFNPWSGNCDHASHVARLKERKSKSGAHFIVKWQKILACTKRHIHQVEQEL